MESIKSHCWRAYNSATPSPPTQQLPLSSLVPHPAILPLASCMAVVYCCIHFKPCPGGRSCRSRLWEICVGNLIWSPRDLSEWAASVCGLTLDTGPHTDEGLSVPGWKERSEPTGLALKLMWHYCAPQFNQVARLSQAKWGSVSAVLHSASLDSVSHLFQKLLLYFTDYRISMSLTLRKAHIHFYIFNTETVYV